MAVRLGDTAPDFTADTTAGRDQLPRVARRLAGACCSATRRTSRRSAPPSSATSPRSSPSSTSATSRSSACRSTRSTATTKWEADIAETQGTPVNFPMIGDPDRKVADLYDMIHPNANDTLTVRSVFVIGPDKKVKLTHHLPGLDRPQLRRDPARDRQPAAHRQAQGRHAGQLEGRRRRHHRPRRHQRGGQEAVPAGLDHGQAVPAHTAQPNK